MSNDVRALEMPQAGANKPAAATGGFDALIIVVEAVREYFRLREEERSKRIVIEAYAAIELERIRVAGDVLGAYFAQVFDERASTFDALFARLDRATKAGDSGTVSEALGAIVAIAQRSPLADLGDLTKLRAALDDPDHVWQL